MKKYTNPRTAGRFYTGENKQANGSPLKIIATFAPCNPKKQ